MHKVLLDTDIGDDIDDALALGYLMKSPDIFLLGISTVFMDTLTRAKLCMAELQVMNMFHVPVVPGRGNALGQNIVKHLNKKPPRQFEVLSAYKTLGKPHRMEVAAFLNNNIEAHPKEVTLLTIGALTNAALLFKKYPGAAKKLKESVMMGGVTNLSFPEWNIYCDPDAADIVFRSGAPIKMIGLDVTLKCQLEEKHIRMFESSAKALPVLLGKLIRLWQKQHGKNPGTNKYNPPILHDPLAAMAVNTPGLITYKPAYVEVETRGTIARGLTRLTKSYWKPVKNGREITLLPGEKPNALVAIDVDAKKAVRTIVERIMD